MDELDSHRRFGEYVCTSDRKPSIQWKLQRGLQMKQ